MAFSIYSWLQKKWETMSRGLWTTWTTWTVRTRTIGDSDLKVNLLVGDGATHYTNVPGVMEVSGDYFPLATFSNIYLRMHGSIYGIVSQLAKSKCQAETKTIVTVQC